MAPIYVGSGSNGTEAKSDRLGIPTASANPLTGTSGDLYYNTTENEARVYNGTAWVALGGGAGGGGGGTPSGTPPATGVYLGPENDGMSGGTYANANSQPSFNNAYYRRHLIKVRYTASFMAAITNTSTPAGNIVRMRLNAVSNAAASYQPFPLYTIGLKNATAVDSTGSATSFTTVRAPSDYYFSTGWNTFVFSSAFNYTGGDLLIAFAWGMIPSGYVQAGVSWALPTVTTAKAEMLYARTDSGGNYNLFDNATANAGTNQVPWIEFMYN